ncbi:MAG: 3D domain-containing protein [Planctomycetota bacterium]
MEKTEGKSFCGLFANSKPVLIAFFLMTIICVSWYFAGTSYANGNNKITLPSTTADTVKHNIKHIETSNGNSGGHEQWQTVQMRVTAYCPCPKCCGDYSDGVTACGHKISQGDRFIAADKMYPFGTGMIIPGYKSGKVVKVLDRGGVIRGNRLDVFFNSHQEALEWGVRYLDVKIRYQ